MSALCSKEYLMWNIIHFCIEISSAVWKLASGEFYFKKKCKWKREEPESKHHSHKRITTSSWRVQYIQKIVLYPDEWSLFTLQKITFKLGKIRVLASLRHAQNFFSTLDSQEHCELDSPFDI